MKPVVCRKGRGMEMVKDNYENKGERSIRNKNFDPKKYGMVCCPTCKSHGYIQNPKRQCCPKCGGFGFIKTEAEQDTNISTRNPHLPETPYGEE